MTATKMPSTDSDVEDRVTQLQAGPRVCCFWRLFFSDISSLVRLAARNGKLDLSDVWATPDASKTLFQMFTAFWDQEQQKPTPKVSRAIWRLVSADVFRAAVASGCAAVMQLGGPILLNQILRSIEVRQNNHCSSGMARLNNEEYLCKEEFGYIATACFFVTLFCATIGENNSQFLMTKAALKVRGALIVSVYNKSLRLSPLGMNQTGSGFINNLTANDAEQLLMSAQVCANVLFSPLLIIAVMVLLALTVGASFLAGLAAMLMALVITAFIIKKSLGFKVKQLAASDSRIKLTNEMLGGVRVVKAYGWENPFGDTVMQLRKEETYWTLLQSKYFAVLVVVIMTAPAILAVATFSMYSAIGNKLTASKVFTALALLNLIRLPLAFLPFGIGEFIKIKIMLGRFRRMLDADEIQQQPHVAIQDAANATSPPSNSVFPAIEDAVFGYPINTDEGKGKGKGKGGCLGKCFGKLLGGKGKGKGKGKDKGKQDESKSEPLDESLLVEVKRADKVIKFKPALTLKSFELVQGGLTIIVGPIGSGKSTLLSVLLGEVELIAGEQPGFPGQASLTTQVPWIINSSLEGNIKFAAPDRGEDVYQKVLTNACLLDDLNILPAGDQTEIGERGINLSGGQRARIAIARAAYREADLYLFDDPLAAVDAHVGQSLFDNILGANGMLAGKTRVLATHQIQLLPLADQIVVVDGGKIIASGTFDELSTRGMNLEKYVGRSQAESVERAESAEVSHKASADKVDTKKTVDNFSKPRTSGKLTIKEEKAVGNVSLKTYIAFATQAMGTFWSCGTVANSCCNSAWKVLLDMWLANWIVKGHPFGLSTGACIGVYSSLGAIQGLFVYGRAMMLSFGLVNASRRLYRMLYDSVFGSPAVFFDLTPTGQLLNRFTADMDILDNQLRMAIGQTLGIFESIIACLAGIMIAQPLVAVVIFPCILAFILLLGHFRYLNRDVQRLELISKSPIFNRVSETLNGLQTVRAFRYQNHMTELLIGEVDINQSCNLLRIQGQGWLSVRLQLLSILIVTAASLVSVLPSTVKTVDAAFVGLTLAYSLEICRFIEGGARSLLQLEQRFTSPERIFEYIGLPQEAAHNVPSDDALPSSWPQKGSIQFQKVVMRYRAELEPALRGLTFSVDAGQKLGIVGRTGSGKSSIIVTLLRLTECSSGQVLIDGQDVSKMGLQKLRRSLAMIPQDPVLFGKMSLRRNLDPFDDHSDSVLDDALEKVQMSKQSLLDGLQTEIEEGGAPFSVGQRQLLCLARAVLRKSKILLLDEATASVDSKSDELIQQTIREIFGESTVVCIAHRIRTILDSDQVLVVREGICHEFGSPNELLATPNSELRSLAIQSNIEVPSLEPLTPAASTYI